MVNATAVNQNEFRRILSRNIILPLVVGVASAALFVVLIFNLLSAMKWVEHTVEAISEANALTRLAVDMQTGLRGYLLIGEDVFLAPYHQAKPEFAKKIAGLKELVRDNPVQIERLSSIEETHLDWELYAQTVIEMRRSGSGDYHNLVRQRGLKEFENLRSEFEAFVGMEQNLLHDRSETVRRFTIIAVAAFLCTSLFLTGLLSFLGRRDLLRLSASFTENLDALHNHTEVLEQQSWQRAGQAQLAQESMGKISLPLLGQTVLDFLALYIHAVVAAMYVRSDVGSLRRVATYGVNKENSETEQVFEANQSLVGQAAASNRII
ncbi:MAG: two-component system sensor histidine kinase/response regulator, partial [Moraxellaceae bacterium]